MHLQPVMAKTLRRKNSIRRGTRGEGPDRKGPVALSQRISIDIGGVVDGLKGVAASVLQGRSPRPLL